MATQPHDQFAHHVLKQVLELETNDGRFEVFCRSVVSIIEGGSPILGTSASWDLGRDGVGAGAARGVYVCCSLRDDVDHKALSDIERLISTTRNIQRVYFCSSHALSEHRISAIESSLSREIDDKFSVSCLGAGQLAEAALRAPEIIDRHYGAEIKNVTRAIAASNETNEADLRGLRLALIASAGSDSVAIRRELYAAALLDALGDGARRTLDGTCVQLSNQLRLGRSLAVEAARPHLQNLVRDGLVESDGVLYWVTEAGKARVAERDEQAAARLLRGRAAVRGSLEVAMGSRLAEDHFARIWNVIEEKTAAYFASRGEQLVAELSELLETQEADTGGSTRVIGPIAFVEELATAIAATSAHPQQQEELAQAIRDLFADRTGPAAEWLVRVCSSFVAACALGLEHTTSSAIAALLARTSLVLDSDVVLSLLGDGEPEHDSVVAIVTRWTRNGGRILVGEPVLEEVAYHAHIAEADYRQVHDLLPGTAEDRLRIIENVFVRGFAELLSRGQARRGQWGAYISQFKGAKPRDWTTILGELSAEFRIQKLPPRATAESALAEAVRRFLIERAEATHGDVTFNAKDKARRDAELYAAMVTYTRTIRAADPAATCLLVSSARRLSLAETRFRESGEQQLVVTISSVLYLVSLLPDVVLGLSAMRAFLFDERRSGFSSEFERTLLRMIRTSNEVALPFAKRNSLMRSVRRSLVRDAEAEGQRVGRKDIAALEKKALEPESKERTIQLLRESLDEVVVDTRLEKENEELRARIRELERKLDAPGRRS